MGIGLTIAQAFYFLLPAYFANMAPVAFKNVLKPLAKPVDFGRKFMGHDLFGSHKTWRGLFVATIAGTFIFWLQQIGYPFSLFRQLSLFDYAAMPLLFGSALGLGAILGDLVKSFLKRRIGKKSGEMWFPVDQIDFPLGAMLLGTIFFIPVWQIWVAGILLSIALSLLVNYSAFKLGVKDVPF